MIRVCLKGHIGNQMFQYAFGVAAAEKIGCKIQFVTDEYADEVIDYFETDSVIRGYQASAFEIWRFGWRQRFGISRTFSENQMEFSQAFSDNTTYYGYFQNENYFSHSTTAVRAMFKLRSVWTSGFEEIRSKYDFENSIVVSMRLGDYLSWGSEQLGGINMSLPLSYYTNAIRELGDQSSPSIILISDEPSLAYQMLAPLGNVSVLDYPPQLQFQALLNARRLIIPNSTFAWWGAWLNPLQPKIIAPEHWLGFKIGKEFPFGVLPPKFKAVPAY